MKTTFAVAAAAMVGSVAAASNGTASAVYVTEVVTAFTTFCPEATVLTHGSSTYTVTEATTLTISDCPCTITKPASSTAAAVTGAASSAAVSSAAVSAAASSAEVSPVVASSAVVSSAPYPVTNGTATAATISGTAAGTGSASASATVFTGAGAANKASFGGLAAIMGLAAYIL